MTSATLPKGVTALPKGVQIHGNQLRIDFRYKGQRCRESLEVAKITKQAIIYAENKRNLILTEIKEGRFDYAAHFPKSEKAALYSGIGGREIRRTVEEGVDRWLENQEVRRAKSTFTTYRSAAKKIKKRWGKQRISDILKSEIELFQAKLLDEGLSPSSVNTVFLIVRGVWADAFSDGIIKSNPLDRIKGFAPSHPDNVDPFTPDEMTRIEKTETSHSQGANMILFACWSGLSRSELFGLAWEDVDTEQWVVRIQRAYVAGQHKIPKTRARVRDVELLAPAIEILKAQRALTSMLSPIEVSVTQWNNHEKRRELIRPVFRTRQNRPWLASTYQRWLADHLRRAKIRLRGANQGRHTFASRMLSNYVPQEWIARQLGHSDTTMLKKHYARWIPAETPKMAGMISKQIAGTAKGGQSELECADLVPKRSQNDT
jgi:integrase